MEEKKLTEIEILDPKITPEKVSEILYRGDWAEISVLQKNQIFTGYNEEYWPHFSHNHEFFFTPWYPLVFSFLFVGFNVLFSFADGSYSLVIVILSLLYITYGVPLLLKIKENNRIKFLDQILEGSPYHRDLFKKEEIVEEKSPEKKK